MMKIFKPIALFLGLLLLIMMLPHVAAAQPADPCPDPAFPDCPIDGGLSLLIAAGAALGIRKAYRNGQERKPMQ